MWGGGGGVAYPVLLVLVPASGACDRKCTCGARLQSPRTSRCRDDFPGYGRSSELEGAHLHELADDIVGDLGAGLLVPLGYFREDLDEPLLDLAREHFPRGVVGADLGELVVVGEEEGEPAIL